MPLCFRVPSVWSACHAISSAARSYVAVHILVLSSPAGWFSLRRPGLASRRPHFPSRFNSAPYSLSFVRPISSSVFGRMANQSVWLVPVPSVAQWGVWYVECEQACNVPPNARSPDHDRAIGDWAPSQRFVQASLCSVLNHRG